MTRRGYPSDVDDDTYLFLLPYLLLQLTEAELEEMTARIRDLWNSRENIGDDGVPQPCGDT